MAVFKQVKMNFVGGGEAELIVPFALLPVVDVRVQLNARILDAALR